MLLPIFAILAFAISVSSEPLCPDGFTFMMYGEGTCMMWVCGLKWGQRPYLPFGSFFVVRFGNETHPPPSFYNQTEAKLYCEEFGAHLVRLLFYTESKKWIEHTLQGRDQGWGDPPCRSWRNAVYCHCLVRTARSISIVMKRCGISKVDRNRGGQGGEQHLPLHYQWGTGRIPSVGRARHTRWPAKQPRNSNEYFPPVCWIIERPFSRATVWPSMECPSTSGASLTLLVPKESGHL